MVLLAATAASAIPPQVTPATVAGGDGRRFLHNFDESQAGYSVSSAGDFNGDGFDDVVIGAPFRSLKQFLSLGTAYIVYGGPTLAAATDIDLNALNGANGFQIGGVVAGARLGLSVACAGDVNGDGFDDVLLGAPDASPSPSIAGYVYLLLGGPNRAPTGLMSVNQLNGQNGMRISGVVRGEAVGFDVCGLGDLNEDGFDDFAIGAPAAPSLGQSGAGAVYVVYGGPTLFASITTNNNVPLALINGENGFVVTGFGPGDNVGWSVSGVGDFNGDGLRDFAIGAPNAGPPGLTRSGIVWVVFGGPDLGASGVVSLATFEPGAGIVFRGIGIDYRTGIALASDVDLNGDGFSDLAIGAPTATPAGVRSGQVYVAFGGPDRHVSGVVQLGNIPEEDGFTLDGPTGDEIGDAGDLLGFALATGGDLNGDGVNDLLLGSPTANEPGLINAGRAYGLFGRPSLGASPIDLNHLSARQGIVFAGAGINHLAGRSVAFAGDVNGDGVADMIVGAPGADREELRAVGETYVVFGRRPLLGDINCDGQVGPVDLAAVLSRWGSADPDTDLNDDGVVNGQDLQIVLASWRVRGD